MFHPKGPTFLELAAQAMSSTTKGYDLIAKKFEYTPFRTPDALLELMMEHIGPHGSVGKGLDVCCGTGAVTRALRPLCTEGVTGIDISAGMLDEARARFSEAKGEAEGTFVQGDALKLPFTSEFDVATCCGAFGHIEPEDQDRFIRGVYRALKPGGRFVFITSVPLSPADRSWWLYRGFNATMRVRNVLWDPPFIMYYLIFTLPRALEVLTRNGFKVQVHQPFTERPHSRMRVVVASRPE
jgi:ubiquinone/menaquinone biosynthesis C-methylase UbiE